MCARSRNRRLRCCRQRRWQRPGRLSASIAHEINNPLQSVQNCLHLAAHEDLPEAKRREYFEMASAEVERLSVTVRRMLDFYRPGSAKSRAAADRRTAAVHHQP